MTASTKDKLTWILIVLPYIAAQTCYRQNGTQFGSGNDYICNNNTEFSMCCDMRSMCTTNGLCKSRKAVGNGQDNMYWRTGCTDPTWKSPSCSGFCNATIADPDAPGGSHKVIACSETTYCCAELSVDTARDPYYCCPGNRSATSDLLMLGPANYLAGIQLFTTWPPNPSATSTQPAVPTASSSASLVTPTSDGRASASGGDGLSNGAIAGIAVGATVAVIAALIVAVFLCMRHKQREPGRTFSRGSENETEQMVQDEGFVLPENKQQGALGKGQPGEMYTEGRAAELPIEDRSYELYTEDRRAELPGGNRL